MAWAKLIGQTQSGWSLYGGRVHASVPARVEVTPRDTDVDPYNYTVRMVLDIVDGELHCVELCTVQRRGGPLITSENVRRFPVASYVEFAAHKMRLVAESDSGSPDFAWPPLDFAEQGMTDAALEHVARVYAWCMAVGLKPSGELHKRYGLARPTTSRWLATARRRRILVEGHERLPEPPEPTDADREAGRQRSRAAHDKIMQMMTPGEA